MNLIQGSKIDQFTHLRVYSPELLKSNPKSSVDIQCSKSDVGHVFERIYIYLEAL